MYTAPMSHRPKTHERMQVLKKVLSKPGTNGEFPSLSLGELYTIFKLDNFAERDSLRTWLNLLVANDVLYFEIDPHTQIKMFSKGPAWERFSRDINRLRERYLEANRGVVRRSSVVVKEPDPLYEAWGMRLPADWHDKPFRGARIYIDPLVRRNGQKQSS
jgi:hypothetical protein